MSMQEKLGKFGSFVGEKLDLAKKKAEEMKVKERVVRGAKRVAAGTVEGVKGFKQGFNAEGK